MHRELALRSGAPNPELIRSNAGQVWIAEHPGTDVPSFANVNVSCPDHTIEHFKAFALVRNAAAMQLEPGSKRTKVSNCFLDVYLMPRLYHKNKADACSRLNPRVDVDHKEVRTVKGDLSTAEQCV